MSVQFIDNASIDKKTRSLIRSHVAKGKNLGRTVYRPSRYPKKRQVAAVSAIPSTEPDKNSELSPSIQRKFQEDLATSLPFAVSRACRRLFHEFVTYANAIPCPPELGNTIIQGRGPRLFLQYAFVDEAFFHCVVAMSVAASVSLSVTRRETAEAFGHLSRSLRLVNQRLAGAGELVLSDATLAVVVAMTQHERLLGYDDHALMHFEGLQRIIKLRGGMSTLVVDCRGVAQKALRADFDFALAFGTPTRFSIAECMPGNATLDWLRERHKQSRVGPPDMLTLIARVGGGLREVFEDTATIAWLFNDSAVHGVKMDDYDFHDVLLIVGYRLLNIRPFNTPATAMNRSELLLHLGLVAMMAMLFLAVSLKSDVALLKRRIASATLGGYLDDQEGQEVMLWLLFTAKASVFKEAEEDIWLLPRISHLASQLDLSTWDDVSRTLQKFPWVKAFADDTAQVLWRQIGSFSRTPF